MKTRPLKDGTKAKELKEPVTLTVYTICPVKWLLCDKETG